MNKPLNAAQHVLASLGLNAMWDPDRRRMPSFTKRGPGRRHVQGPVPKFKGTP